MSHIYYHELWKTAQKQVDDLLELDKKIQDDANPKNREIALQQILPIYLRYRNNVERLISCYDQTIQSQKREIIKKLLDCCIGRMLEYRREIAKLDGDYPRFDDLLIQMKWTLDDVKISKPSSYAADRRAQLDERRRRIDELIEKFDKQSIVKVESEQTISAQPSRFVRRNRRFLQTSSILRVKSEVMTIDDDPTDEELLQEAILMIQSHERARVGRGIAIEAKIDRDFNRKLKNGELELKKYDSVTINKAATIIQKHWRGYAVRLRMKKRIDEVEKLLGMIVPSWRDKSVVERDAENFRRRQELQPKAAERTELKIAEEKTKIVEMRSASLKEDIADEIREWWQLYYEKLGHFGVFPPAGSAKIATGQHPSPEEFSTKKKAKKSSKKREKKDKKGKKEGWTMPKSKALRVLIDCMIDFNNNWSLRDDTEDLSQSEHLDLIHDNIFYDLQLQIREIVDDYMRLELKRLHKALKKDHRKDKKFKIPKIKKGKKKRKKVKKIIPPSEVERMFDELVSAKIIRTYPEAELNDWCGDTSYHDAGPKKMHLLGDLRQTILDYCILPLGSKEAHAIAPLIKSICIVGQPQTGKTFLTNAICTAIGALLIDLTNLPDEFSGKANEKKLIKMIGTCARHYPPAIILIDDGDKPWWRKLSHEKLNHRRLAKLLPKLIKSIKPGDQMLVLGTACEPWRAKKRLRKIYSKFIIIPTTDYNSLYCFYEEQLMKFHGLSRNFDISALAKASIGYPLEVIREAIENVLKIERRMCLKFRPLEAREILTELLKWEGPPAKELKKFRKFANKIGKIKKKV